VIPIYQEVWERVRHTRQDPRFTYEFTVSMSEPHHAEIIRWVTSQVPYRYRSIVTGIWETHVFLQRAKDAVHLRLRWGDALLWQVPR
jgi:hypothetical protein